MNNPKPPSKNHSPTALQSAITKRQPQRKLSTLQQRLQKHVDSGNFRMLNETMYTTTGAQSLELMRDDPSLFQLYHAGYSEQVKRWPSNPLDSIIRYLRTQSSKLRVADLGCGEARLAREVGQQVASFDLVAVDDSVVECDIADVPLGDSSMDIAVFCLSLMGTNYGEYIREARRILAPKGLLLVAEVASRFEQHDATSFVAGVEAMGFKADKKHPLVAEGASGGSEAKRRKGGGRKKKKKKRKMVDSENNSTQDRGAAFFFQFVFRSTKSEIVGDEDGQRPGGSSLPRLGACLYKKR